MSELLNLLSLYNKYEDIMNKLLVKLSSGTIFEKERCSEYIKEYNKLSRSYILYPEEIEFIKKFNKHPSKNIKKLTEGLEFLLIRMERETKSILS